jgi:mannose-6-phosphate isomerase-like protein (cupin superfamily)
MRLIITGHDAAGRSIVASDEQRPDRGMVALFTAGAGEVDNVGTGTHIATVPDIGSAVWMQVDISPDATMRDSLRKGVAGIDPDGWHTTPTVDYVQVIEGDVFLALDTGEVELHAGDCVVQRATRHAWRNRTDRPARIAAVMMRL